MAIIYDLTFIILGIVYFPYLLIKGKWHNGFLTRFGFLPRELKGVFNKRANIWVHAVSVGEVTAIGCLIQEIKKQFPSFQIVISTVTRTGYEVAKKAFVNDAVIYAPLDLSGVVKKYIDWIAPKIYIVAETELWPNLFLSLHQRSIPIVVVNGRISDKAYPRYKIVKYFLKKVLDYVDAFCMRSSEDSERIKTLGAPLDRVRTIGNIKFDDVVSSQTIDRKKIGFGKDEVLFVGGSTHPGEEEILLNVYRALREEFPKLRLILAPRHIERSDEVAGLIAGKGFLTIRLSEITRKGSEKNSVVLIDTMGQLKSIYQLADIVFVGKSLKVGGGQNIIEPASFAKPIVVGPRMENFADTLDAFLKSKAIIQVRDSKELQSNIRLLLQNSGERMRLGQLAYRVVQENKGASERTMGVVSKFLMAAK